LIAIGEVTVAVKVAVKMELKAAVLVTESDTLLRLRADDEAADEAWRLMRLLVMVIDILFFLSCLTWRK